MPKNADNEIFRVLLRQAKTLFCGVLIIRHLTSWLALEVMLRELVA